MDSEDGSEGGQRKFGFRIYENFRNIVKKSSKNYDLTPQNCVYEDVEVTSQQNLSSLDSSMTTDSLNVIKNDGNTTDDSGIDSIAGHNSSPEPQNGPIYSSVVKNRKNPARDFALTVLEDHNKKSADLTEISQLLSSTNALLARNSNLRASLTIRVQGKNKQQIIDIPLVQPDRKDSTSGNSDTSDDSENIKRLVKTSETIDSRKRLSTSGTSDSCYTSGRLSTSDSCQNSDSCITSSTSDSCNTSEEESSESTLPSLEPNINNFTRYNPTRRPINGHSMEVRRSIRLAPKTVASLASKFDSLQKPSKSSKDVVTSRNLGKKDIAQIINTLEKLDEDAKKASLVLQKNKKSQIDNLMKSTKSALEEVELPSQNVSSTDKYLQTLQKIAKENAETGQFRTSLPKTEIITENVEKNMENPKIEVTKDEIEDEPLDLLVTATPAIVTEDQLDSLSFYDDVKSLGGDLYESIAGSILNLAKRNSSMEDMYSSVLYSPGAKVTDTEEDSGPFSRSTVPRSSSVYSAGQKSVTSDEWIDLEEEESDYGDRNFARGTNVRNSRMSLRKRWQNRSTRRNWAQMASTASKKGGVETEEELYESIYEVIQPRKMDSEHFESESDFDEIEVKPLNRESGAKLTKLAEAANKKMRKLRRNWSLKKSDISKSWSRIRKLSNPPRMPPTITISHSNNTLKRKPSSRRTPANTGAADPKSVVRHHGGPVVGDGSSNDTTFYITLTIEQDDDDDDPLERIDTSIEDKTVPKKKGWRSKRRVGGGSTSTSGASSSSHAEHDDSRSATISMSSSSVMSGMTSKSSPDTSITCSESSVIPPKLPKPRKPTRPTEAPPAPPPRTKKPLNFHLGSPHFDVLEDNSDGLNNQEPYMSSFFQTEPLYQQFYTNQLVNIESSIENTMEDMYECVGGRQQEIPQEEIEVKPRSNRPSAMDLTSACPGGRRSMWSELPEVVHSGILDNISIEAKKLHEAMFEVITSEASYLKSLNVLMTHFAQSPKLSGLAGETSVISKWDHKRLFGDVINVRQCSERFLEDLEKKWQASVLLDGLCEVVRDHAAKHFQVYVKYCSNQVDQGKLLKELSENPRFVESLKELESSPVCQALKMQSFLMLPMQRITRLPLLIGAIFSRLDESSAEFEPCKEAVEIIEKLVHECNDSALIEGRRKEMLLLEQQLKFRGDVKLFPLCSASRWLVKRGDATRIYWKENAEAKLTFGRKVSKQSYNFLLFNDILVIAKKKSDGNFLVVDYCPRNLVQMSNLLEEDGKLPYGMANAKNIDLNQVVLFTMLQNHEHKTMEWLLTFPTESEKNQWIELVTPNTTSPENPAEKIYEDWDCPLVEAVENVQEADVNLQKGDKANVLRKLSDSGWYYIEKLTDGQKGWVPISSTREIESNHIRARNFKQRHAFLKLLTSMDPLDSDLLNNNGQLTNRYSYYDD